MNKGMLLILSGPSGSGKGTVVNRIRQRSDISVSISVTTRQPRPGETDGVNYLFKTREEFLEMVKNDDLLEHVQFVGNLYGTPRSYVEEQIQMGRTVVLEIDPNGALQVQEKFPMSVLLFLLPPTYEELKQRLIKRATETKETIEERLRRAIEEIKLISKYDYLVINEDVDEAAGDIFTIIAAEKMKPIRSADRISMFKGESNA